MTVADLILKGAVVHTADRSRPRATALAVADGRLLAVGTEEEVLATAGPATQVRDLDGATVIPGLVDVHNHHLMAGEADLFQLAFSPTAGLDEVLEAVRAWAAGLGPDEWVVGEAFGSVLLDDFARAETRARFDEAAGGRPVVLSSRPSAPSLRCAASRS